MVVQGQDNVISTIGSSGLDRLEQIKDNQSELYKYADTLVKALKQQ